MNPKTRIPEPKFNQKIDIFLFFNVNFCKRFLIMIHLQFLSHIAKLNSHLQNYYFSSKVLTYGAYIFGIFTDVKWLETFAISFSYCKVKLSFTKVLF